MFCAECGRKCDPDSKFCPSCGAALQVPEEPPRVEETTASAPPADEPTVVAASPSPPGEGHTRKLLPLLAGALGVVALGGVAFALVGGGGSSSGGADSPKAAVQRLASAITAEDPAAVLAIVDPDEKRSLGDVYATFERVGKSSGAITGSGGVSGLSINLDGLKLTDDDRGHGVHRITVSGGKLDARVTASGFGTALRPKRDSQRSGDLATDDPLGLRDTPLTIMVREHDGRWFVSPTMTAMEYVVDFNNLPAGDFSLLDTNTGDATSSAAPKDIQALVTQAAGAASRQDVAGVLDLVTPKEAAALRPYTPALQELVGRAGGTLSAQISRVDASEKDLGSGLVRYDVRHASGAGAVNGDGVEFTLNGLCLAINRYGSNTTACDRRNVRRLFGVEQAFIVGQKSGDGVRLAPLATVLQYLRQLTQTIGSPGIARVLGTVRALKSSGSVGPAESTGKLDSGGLAVRGLSVPKPGFVAVTSDHSTLLLDAKGVPHTALTCINGASLYKVPSAGAYKVVIAADGLQPGSYHVAAEPLDATQAKIGSNLSGTIPAGHLQVVAFDSPPNGATLDTQSKVATEIVSDDSDNCYDGDPQEIFGPDVLLNDIDMGSSGGLIDAFRNSGTGYGASTYESGPSYVVVAGEKGTTWHASLKENVDYYGE